MHLLYALLHNFEAIEQCFSHPAVAAFVDVASTDLCSNASNSGSSVVKIPQSIQVLRMLAHYLEKIEAQLGKLGENSYCTAAKVSRF